MEFIVKIFFFCIDLIAFLLRNAVLVVLFGVIVYIIIHVTKAEQEKPRIKRRRQRITDYKDYETHT